MLHSKHQDKIAELADSIRARLRIEAEHLARSGAIDPDDYNPDEYRLAKICLTAALHRIKDDYAPLDEANKKTVRNLQKA